MGRRLLIGALGSVAALAALFAVLVHGEYRDAQRQSRVGTLAGFDVQYVLRAAGFEALGGVGADFDVTSSGTIVLAAQRGLVEIDPRQEPPSALDLGAAPASLAVDSGDTVLAVTDEGFGRLDPQGRIAAAVPLPFPGMRVSRSADAGAIYLYGGEPATGFRLYQLRASGELDVMLRLEEPIVAVADSRKATYVATADAIYRIPAGGREIALLLPFDAAAFDGKLVSIAAAEDDASLFFATERRVYAFRDRGGLSIVNDSGGPIRLRGERLYVLDPARRLLYVLQPLGILTRGRSK
jgi:hypothetical protein